jgi:hypothetical protein
MADEVFPTVNFNQGCLTLDGSGLFEVISMIQIGWLSSHSS